MLNTLRLLFCLILFMALAACSSQPDAHDSKGQAIRLSDYKGKWVIINYWATWCKPCLKEIPALSQLYRDHSNKVLVLGVSYDQLSNSEIEKVSKKFSVSFPMLSAFPIHKLGVKDVKVLPITFIINPEGKWVKTLKGPQTKQQFAQAVDIR